MALKSCFVLELYHSYSYHVLRPRIPLNGSHWDQKTQSDVKG